MSRPIVYVEKGQVYRTDSCVPQVRAVNDKKVRMTALARGGYPGQRLPDQVLPGVRIIGTITTMGRQDWGTEWHYNEGIEIAYLENGQMPFLVDDRKYTLQWGDLTVTRPWQIHRNGDPHITDGRHHFLIIDVGVRRPDQPWRWPSWVVLLKKDLQELTDILRHREDHVCHANREIRQCFQNLARLVETYKAENNASHLHAKINELLVLILNLLREQAGPLNRELSGRRHTVKLFLQDLSANPGILVEDWTAESMARHCGLCASTFLAYCKDLTNLTPNAYLTRCRIERAAILLRKNPGMTITEVAFATGFQSSQYFATVFRKFNRCAPSGFRRIT